MECSLFATFTQLRDEMRAEMKAKNSRNAIALGAKIVALDKSAECLGIATQIFLRDMGRASLALGDNEAAERYFVLSADPGPVIGQKISLRSTNALRSCAK